MPTPHAAVRCILPLVLGVSYAVAFLPPPYALGHTASALYMGHARLIHWRWEPPSGYHPAILRDAVDPLYYIRRWPMWSAAARRDAPDGQHHAMARPWTKPIGYDPALRNRCPVHPWIKRIDNDSTHTPAPGTTRWTPPIGYDPARGDYHCTDEAGDAVNDLAPAPGTTRWTPPIGYDPARGDYHCTHKARDSAQDLAPPPGTTRWTPPIRYDPARGDYHCTDEVEHLAPPPGTTRWTPPIGYDPTRRRPRRVSWTPPMGYDPASRHGGPHDPETPDILHLGVVVANKLIAEFGSGHV